MVRNKNLEKMRFEVIENCILLENELEEEISSFFSFNKHKASYYPKLEKERNLFVKSFLNTNLSRKIMIIKEIIKLSGGKLYKDFNKDAEKFRQIRNEFAHTFAPDKIDKEDSKWAIERTSIEQKEWENKYKEAEKLFYGIISAIHFGLYSKKPHQRKYRSFDEDEKQWLIKRYEEVIENKKSKENKGST